MENKLDEVTFRKLFIVEASHDLSMSKRYSNRISLLTDGGEKVSELYEKIEHGLLDFDPEADAVIPMGKVVSCMIAGMVLADMFPSNTGITIGVYRGDSYEFINLGKDV
jgi:hypothetical protein